ncbi:hypothetical protein SLS61_004354 [Didymella pomorum]
MLGTDEVANIFDENVAGFLMDVVRHVADGLDIPLDDRGKAVSERKLFLHAFTGSVSDEAQEYKGGGALHFGVRAGAGAPLDYNERPAISKLCRVKERKRKTKIEDN